MQALAEHLQVGRQDDRDDDKRHKLLIFHDKYAQGLVLDPFIKRLQLQLLNGQAWTQLAQKGSSSTPQVIETNAQ